MSPRLLLSLTALLAATHSYAKEYPIGEPQQCAGMEVGAVYLQPIVMDPPGMMRPAAESDVHMEADISALESNAHGFQEGSFVPYLNISYRLPQKMTVRFGINNIFNKNKISDIRTTSNREFLTLT